VSAAADQVRLQGLEGSSGQGRGALRILNAPGDETLTDSGASTPRKDGTLPEPGGKPSSEGTRDKPPGERTSLLARRALDVVFGKDWSADLARYLLSILAAPFTLPGTDDVPGARSGDQAPTEGQEQTGDPPGNVGHGNVGRISNPSLFAGRIGNPSDEVIPDGVWCSPGGVLGGALLAAAFLPAARPSRARSASKGRSR
jgi:hypothetical protein